MSNTPRTDAAYAASTGAGIYELFKEAQDIERELNAANERIKRLIAERDTAQRQADSNWRLREEFRELLGTDDVLEAVNVVRGMQERITRLEEAGDAMANDHNPFTFIDWQRAKEAKP